MVSRAKVLETLRWVESLSDEFCLPRQIIEFAIEQVEQL